MPTKRGAVACEVCGGRIAFDLSVCWACGHVKEPISYFIEQAFRNLVHKDGCPNKDTAVRQQPDGTFKCNGLVLGEDLD